MKIATERGQWYKAPNPTGLLRSVKNERINLRQEMHIRVHH